MSRRINLLIVPLAASLPCASQAQVELRGRVISTTGDPIPAASIMLTSIGYSVRSDSAGFFRLSGQPGSTLTLSLKAVGYRDDTASVTLLRRGSLTRDFSLTSADSPAPGVNPSDKLLLGRVEDESGQPLSYANIQLNFGRRFVADDSGRFRVPYPGNGTATVIIRRIGFEPAEVNLREMPDTSLRVRLKVIPTELEGVVVTGASAFRSLDIHGFYQRMKDVERGINHGYFITPEDLEKRKPVHITSMAEGLPTVRVYNGEILGSLGCTMTVYLDNVRIVGRLLGADDIIDEIVRPTHVAAMEIYPRGINAPPSYQLSNGTCGIVLIWTK